MPLQWEVLSQGVERLAAQAVDATGQEFLTQARRRLQQVDAGALRAKIRSREPRFPWLTAIPTGDSLASAYAVARPTPPFSVSATDGSNIAPDRHSPVRFFVLNMGRATLTYGPDASARLEATTELAYRAEDLYIDAGRGNIPIEDARLGIKMAVGELCALAEVVQAVPKPVLGIIDGSLILWGLQSEPRSVQVSFLDEFISALDSFRQAHIPLASYISYPGGQDVANSLRVAMCRDDPTECESCGLPEADQALCRFLGMARDRAIFSGLLGNGERSDVFESASAILSQYGEHRIQFTYLNNGDEVVRLEAPQWVMRDEALRTLTCELVLDQCRRSATYPPYPPVLQEAHEQAVIPVGERELVEDLIVQALASRGVVYVRSAKEGSKHRRAV